MFCTKCGRENVNNAAFCSGCGETLTPAGNLNVEPNQTETANTGGLTPNTNQAFNPNQSDIFGSSTGSNNIPEVSQIPSPGYYQAAYPDEDSPNIQEVQPSYNNTDALPTNAFPMDPEPMAATPKGKSKRTLVLALVLSAVGILLIAAAAYFLLLNKGTAKTGDNKLPYDPNRPKNEEFMLAQEYSFANINMAPLEGTNLYELYTRAAKENYVSSGEIKFTDTDFIPEYSEEIKKFSLKLNQQADPNKLNHTTDFIISYDDEELTAINFSFVDNVLGIYSKDLFDKRLVLTKDDAQKFAGMANISSDTIDSFFGGAESKKLMESLDFEAYKPYLDKYRNIITTEINPDDVTVTTGQTYSKNNVFKGREVSYSIDSKTISKILVKILEDAQEDEKLMMLIYSDLDKIGKVMKSSGNDIMIPTEGQFKSAYKSGLSVLISQLKSTDATGFTLDFNTFIDDEGNIINNDILLSTDFSPNTLELGIENQPADNGYYQEISINYFDGYETYGGFINCSADFGKDRRYFETILDLSNFSPDLNAFSVFLSVENKDNKDDIVVSADVVSQDESIMMKLQGEIEKKSSNLFDNTVEFNISSESENIKLGIGCDTTVEFNKPISLPDLQSPDNFNLGKATNSELMAAFSKIYSNIMNLAVRFQNSL